MDVPATSGRHAACSLANCAGRREDRFGPSGAQVEAGPPPINREITISEGITLKELSEKLDVKAALVMKKLMDRGIFATINQTLDSKLATEVAREFGASTATISYEEEAMQAVEEAEDTKDLQRRAPVVTIMGHVDHGETSLLDAIREANVGGTRSGRNHPAHRRATRWR